MASNLRSPLDNQGFARMKRVRPIDVCLLEICKKYTEWTGVGKGGTKCFERSFSSGFLSETQMYALREHTIFFLSRLI